MLLDDPASSPTGRWRVRPIGGNHERAEPVSFDRFGHGQASRQALKTVFFRLQSLSRHSYLVVWRSSRGDGSSSLVFFNIFASRVSGEKCESGRSRALVYLTSYPKDRCTWRSVFIALHLDFTGGKCGILHRARTSGRGPVAPPVAALHGTGDARAVGGVRWRARAALRI